MEFAEFRKQAKAGRLEPAYLLRHFGSAEAEKVLQLLQQAPRPPAVEVLRESFLAPDQVVDALVSARSHPMWGEHKLITLGAMETLEAKGQEKALEALVRYLRDPSPWATLVMISAKDSGPDKGLSPLARRAAVVEPPQVTRASLAAWVRRGLSEAQLDIEPEALDSLLERCQGEWTAIEKEMEKIIAAFAPGTRIGADALDFVVEPRVEESVFTLLRLLAEGETGQALEKLNALLSSGRQERDGMISLTYWLYRQTRELLGMAAITARGLGPEAVAAIGISPRAQGILRRQMKSFSPSVLREMLPVLEQVDRQLKSSYTSQPKILLERYVIRLGRSQSRRERERPGAPAAR